MKTILAQVKYKPCDFEFNYKQIVEQIEKNHCDLIIFPECNIESLGGKDLIYDDISQKLQTELYQKIAANNYSKAVLIGDVLIHNGEVAFSDDGFFVIYGKTVYVDELYRDDVICDLYVLAKNKYFVMNSYKDFVESITTTNNFIYINAVMMADENIYAGTSFAKNKDNELVLQMPVCKEESLIVDFNTPVEFKELQTEDSIYKVTTFALKEYCENTGFNKVILGLSGGIDSAVTAVLAADAIGAENVLGIMMPSMYSSEGSVTDSVALAQKIGIKTEKHSITPLFDNFMEKIAHELKGDLAEENLQARLRALILMFFSNRDNRLLLSTGNKSEIAMGFGTLYGDMAGGLNLIADLTKTNVYKLANYINRNEEIIPVNIINKAPSAELHPGQKDQDRLPEYEILDDIIEMYIEQNQPIEEISKKYGRLLVLDTIKKIYRSQFKRKQACLGVRLTEKSFLNGVNMPVIQKVY